MHKILTDLSLSYKIVFHILIFRLMHKKRRFRVIGNAFGISS